MEDPLAPAGPAASPSPPNVTPATTQSPAPAQPTVAAAPAAPKPVESKTPVDDLVVAGKITADEGAVLNKALRGQQGDGEKTLASRLLIDHTLTPEEWRSYTGLVAPADENVAKLRPWLAADLIHEKEFGWLHEALAGGKGRAEQTLAQQLVEEKSLTPAQWRGRRNCIRTPIPFLKRSSRSSRPARASGGRANGCATRWPGGRAKGKKRSPPSWWTGRP